MWWKVLKAKFRWWVHNWFGFRFHRMTTTWHTEWSVIHDCVRSHQGGVHQIRCADCRRVFLSTPYPPPPDVSAVLKLTEKDTVEWSYTEVVTYHALVHEGIPELRRTVPTIGVRGRTFLIAASNSGAGWALGYDMETSQLVRIDR